MHSLALVLTLALNHLANELLQMATMLCGLMHGSATELEYLHVDYK